MLSRLLPRHVSNDYQGWWLALCLLVPILLMKIVIGFNLSGLNPFVSVAEILRTVDGVPIDSFSPEAVRAVLASTKSWGMAMLTLCLFVWLIVLRYRAALPLAILALLFEQVGRTGGGLVTLVHNMLAGSGPAAAGGWINLIMTGALGQAFLLSLLTRRTKGLNSSR